MRIPPFVKSTAHTITHHVKEIKRRHLTHFLYGVLINGVIILWEFVYLFLRYKYLSPNIPFWYSLPWGDFQLDYKRNIFLLPILGLAFLSGGIALISLMQKYYVRYLAESILWLVTAANILLAYSLMRIVY